MSGINKIGRAKCLLNKDRCEIPRDKENIMSERREDEEKLKNVSLTTPSPSKKDFEEYDKTHRNIRNDARNIRIEERRTGKTSNKEYLTPDKPPLCMKSPDSKNSSNNDAYFTPIDGSTDASFSTPMSPQDATIIPPQTTPISRFSHGLSSFEEMAIRQKILDDRMDRNFKEMNNWESVGTSSVLKQTVSPPLKQSKIDLPSSVHRKSQNSIPSPVPSPAVRLSELAKLAPNKTSTLIANLRLQRAYAKGATELEKRLDELEKLQQNATASFPLRNNKRSRDEVHDDMLRTIDKLKGKLAKIVRIKRSIHRLGQNSKFEIGEEDSKRMQIYEEFINLPYSSFRQEAKREYNFLSRQMELWVRKFREILEINKGIDDGNRSMRRSSDVIKITPNPPLDTSKNSIIQKVYLRDVETQVTPRLAENQSVEKLDLAKLEKSSEKTQIEELDEILSKIVLKPGYGLDKSLNESIVNESFTDRPSISEAQESSFLDKSKQFEDVYPRNISVEAETPRSARSTIDSATGRRLSESITHFLEEYLKSQENEGEQVVESSSCSNTVMKDENEDTKVLDVDCKPNDDSEKDSDKPCLEELVIEGNPESVPVVPSEPRKSIPIAEFLANYDAIMSQEQKMKESLPMQVGNLSSDFNPSPLDDEEGDETKKFVTTSGEYDDDLSGEAIRNNLNDSADDSGFLLDDKPFKLPPSILDSLSSDTPRKDILNISHDYEEPENQFDVEQFCRGVFLEEVKLTMINALIEKHERLRGCNWLIAQSVLPPEMFELGKEIPNDPFECFDSFVIRLWGSLVDLLNKRFLKNAMLFDVGRQEEFRKEAFRFIVEEFGISQTEKEFHEKVRVPKRIAGFLPHSIDYRYEVRRAMSDDEKMAIQMDQLNSTVVYPIYSVGKLEEYVNRIIATDAKYMERNIMQRIREELDGEPEDEVGETSI